jgi:enoyl-[acyl-carrier protein] reductase II
VETVNLEVLGVGVAPVEFIKNEIRKTKELTSKPFAINVIMIPEMIDQVTQAEQPPIKLR